MPTQGRVVAVASSSCAQTLAPLCRRVAAIIRRCADIVPRTSGNDDGSQPLYGHKRAQRAGPLGVFLCTLGIA